MYRTLSDLRILKLVLAIEDALEGYESYLCTALKDPNIRISLDPLFEEGPAHQKIRKAHETLRQKAWHQEDEVGQEEALQVMLDCERGARDLYLRYLDRLTDPELVAALRELAGEEERHARIVEEAIWRSRKQRKAAWV